MDIKNCSDFDIQGGLRDFREDVYGKCIYFAGMIFQKQKKKFWINFHSFLLFFKKIILNDSDLFLSGFEKIIL